MLKWARIKRERMIKQKSKVPTKAQKIVDSWRTIITSIGTSVPIVPPKRTQEPAESEN